MISNHDGCICAECEDRRRDAERYERLKRIHRVGFSDRYLLFRHSGADISSEEFDQALDALAETFTEPGERDDS